VPIDPTKRKRNASDERLIDQHLTNIKSACAQMLKAQVALAQVHQSCRKTAVDAKLVRSISYSGCDLLGSISRMPASWQAL
jgi:hypothetical protein